MMQQQQGLILELDKARPATAPGEAREAALTLHVAPGDLLLIEARDRHRQEVFADLCAGCLDLAEGSVTVDFR